MKTVQYPNRTTSCVKLYLIPEKSITV